MSFNWKPSSYDDAKRLVDMARSRTGHMGEILALYMPDVIRHIGLTTGDASLTCPAPTNDPGGKYRVGLDASGSPDIQKLDPMSNSWASVPEVEAKVSKQEESLREALELLGRALMATGVPEDIRALMQGAYDRVNSVMRS